MKPLIIGEAPSRNVDPTRPMSGRIGARLAGFCSVSIEDFLRIFARINALDRWPGRGGIKGDLFDVSAARQRALALRRRCQRGRTVIVLGKRVAVALSLRPAYFIEQHLHRARAFVVPHPSGVNRWYNVANHRVLMTQFMQARVSEAKRAHAWL